MDISADVAQHYERVKLLGRGAHGAVYLYRRLCDGELFVFKQLMSDSLTAAEREKALQEVRVLEQLNHPNIITYYEHIESDDQSIWIVMEHAKGGNLAELISTRLGNPFDEQELLLYFAQLVLSLHHLHTQRILHRDLKTQNVLLNHSRKVLKLSDFGISTVLQSRSKATSILGTPNYLSPEICMNKPYNSASDVWSLGCILYELATMKKAFDGASLNAVVLKIVQGHLDPVPSRYSSALRRLIYNMLHHDPTQRPDTVQIMANPLMVRPLLTLMTDLGGVCGVAMTTL